MDVPPPGAALAAAGLNLRQEGSGFEKFKRSRTALTVVAGLASEVMRPGTAGNRFSYVKPEVALAVCGCCGHFANNVHPMTASSVLTVTPNNITER